MTPMILMLSIVLLRGPSAPGVESSPVAACPDVIFPTSNADLLYPGTSTPVRTRYREHYAAILRTELAKYPQSFLDTYVHSVRVVETLRYNGAPYGGTYRDFDVIICCGAYPPHPVTDLAFRSLLHAEISSIIFNHVFSTIDKLAWEAALPAGFRYSNDAVEFVSRPGAYENPPVGRPDASGFLNSYSMTDMENDFNTYASALFLGNPHATLATTRRIADKVRTFIAAYERADPACDFEFFAIKTLRPDK